jgi:septal ring factor EnvC (AmiA/AmiB activator)
LRYAYSVVTEQESVGKLMKRASILVSLLLSGLMAGCASDADLHALQEDTSALARQNSAYNQTVAARVQQLSDRVSQFEQSQAETRHEVARAAATVDELRVQLQRLQGDVQETQHLAQRGPTGEGGASAAEVANFETRLGEMERQLGVTPP